MMFKGLLTTLLTAGISIATTLIAVDWQRESLVYTLSEPVHLGSQIHQQLRITNEGWEPATNVKVFVRAKLLSADQVSASPPFDLAADTTRIIGGYERIRRNESVLIDFNYSGTALDPTHLSIKSDHSIAVEDEALDEATLGSWVLNVVRSLRDEEKPAAPAGGNSSGNGCIAI